MLVHIEYVIINNVNNHTDVIGDVDLLHKSYQQLLTIFLPLYLKYKDRELIYIIAVVMMSLETRMLHFYRRARTSQGFPQSADSQWFLDYAHSLMANFRIELNMNDILYFGYNILLTVLLAIFKYPIVIIFIQAITTALSVILVYQIANMLFNRVTAVIASIFYSQEWHITIWSMYILSDSFFLSLLLLCIYSLLKFIESNQRKYGILFIGTSLYMLVFRPTGIVSMIFIIIYILINLQRKVLIHFVKKYRLLLSSILIIAVASIVYIYTGDKLEPLFTSMQFNAKSVLYNIYANGWIYDTPSPQDHAFKVDYTINIWNSLIASFMINNWDNILILYGKRSIAFIGRWVWSTDLSTIPGVFKFMRDMLPSLFFMTGTIAAIRNRLFKKSSIVWLLILAVYLFCIVFFIDAVYRYKVPALPFIAIVCAYGVDRILNGAIIMINKGWSSYYGNKNKLGRRSSF